MGKRNPVSSAISAVAGAGVGSIAAGPLGGLVGSVVGGLDLGGIASGISKSLQPPKPKLPQDPSGTAQGDAKLADTAVYGSSYSQQLSQRLAASAGGTLFARASQTPIGNDANGQRKSLLGA